MIAEIYSQLTGHILSFSKGLSVHPLDFHVGVFIHLPGLSQDPPTLHVGANFLLQEGKDGQQHLAISQNNLLLQLCSWFISLSRLPTKFSKHLHITYSVVLKMNNKFF